MAKKKKTPKPGDPGYMKFLGQRGGEATRNSRPKGYYRKIALMSHAVRDKSTYRGGRKKKTNAQSISTTS